MMLLNNGVVQTRKIVINGFPLQIFPDISQTFGQFHNISRLSRISDHLYDILVYSSSNRQDRNAVNKQNLIFKLTTLCCEQINITIRQSMSSVEHIT